MTTKEQVKRVLDRLPDDCSLDEVQYRLSIVEMLDQRIAEAHDPATELVPHEEVVKRFKQWISGR